jgi:hypothetical protein
MNAPTEHAAMMITIGRDASVEDQARHRHHHGAGEELDGAPSAEATPAIGPCSSSAITIDDGSPGLGRQGEEQPDHQHRQAGEAGERERAERDIAMKPVTAVITTS